MGRTRAAAVLLLVLLTGCAADTADDTADPAAAPTARPEVPASAEATLVLGPSTAPAPTAVPAEPATEQHCDHPTEGYRIFFPADWHVAVQDGVEPCSFFSPEPLQLEPGSEASGVAIRADVREVPFEQARADVQAEGGTVLDERPVLERRTARVQGALVEEVLLPAGTRFTTWVVELDAGSLLLTTDDAGEDDYEVAVGVLDQMVAAVEIP